jgi:ABC-type branched-subunit amino acid transport system substrate-binding protein
VRSRPFVPRSVLAFGLALLAAACTGPSASPGPSPSGTRGSPDAVPKGRPALQLQVVATTSGPGAGQDASYLSGMELAVSDVNTTGGVGGRPVQLDVQDDGGEIGRTTEVIDRMLHGRPLAILDVGPGTALTPLRARFEQTDTPVVLLQGDLYSSRALFPQVFQTTLPWEWQAHVIARYVVRDRRAKDVVFIGEGPEAGTASRWLGAALEYWGGRLGASFEDRSGASLSAELNGAFRRAANADWVVVFAPPLASLQLVHRIEEAAGIDRAADPAARPGITGPASLLVSAAGAAEPQPGTSACYTYTWAGWAEPIRRVGAFRAAFTSDSGHAPAGLEQEGYDAVRVLVRALRGTGPAPRRSPPRHRRQGRRQAPGRPGGNSGLRPVRVSGRPRPRRPPVPAQGRAGTVRRGRPEGAAGPVGDAGH